MVSISNQLTQQTENQDMNIQSYYLAFFKHNFTEPMTS